MLSPQVAGEGLQGGKGRGQGAVDGEGMVSLGSERKKTKQRSSAGRQWRLGPGKVPLLCLPVV